MLVLVIVVALSTYGGLRVAMCSSGRENGDLPRAGALQLLPVALRDLVGNLTGVGALDDDHATPPWHDAGAAPHVHHDHQEDHSSHHHHEQHEHVEETGKAEAHIHEHIIKEATTQAVIPEEKQQQEKAGIATGRVISLPMSSMIGPITNSKALIKVKFMFTDSPVPKGYMADHGLIYGKRDNGLMYGWNFFHGGAIVDRARANDIMQDQLIHMYRSKSTWELAVPPGQYAVRVLFGDVMYLTTHTVTVEDVVMAEDLRLGPGIND